MSDTKKYSQHPLALRCLGLFRSSEYRPMSYKEISHHLAIPGEEEQQLKRILEEFVVSSVILLKRGKYEYQKKSAQLQVFLGTITIHPKGFGFVSIQEPKPFKEDVFIPPPFIRDAVEGDTVEIKILLKRPSSKKGPEGEVIRVIKRKRSRVVGTVYKKLIKQSACVYIPIFGSSRHVIVKKSTQRKYAIGDRLLLSVQKWPKQKNQAIECKYLSYLGDISDASIDHSVAALEFEIPTHFPQQVIKEAKAFGKVVKKQDIKGRVDYSSLETFTIDPKTAKDYDDALSIEYDDRGYYHLYVHIADVSHYVCPESSLDKEALLRGNTTYFPFFNYPMLPEELSSDLCSLKEGVLRLTVTVSMTFDETGILLNHRFEKSYIRSQKRFTYEEAKSVLDGLIPSKHVGALKKLEKLFTLLQQQKTLRGAINLATDEIVLQTNHKGIPTGVERVEYDITHQIIEECMLKANELVAKELKDRAIPAPFRIHERPDPTVLEDFFTYARSLHLSLPENPTTVDIQNMFREAEGSTVEKYLSIAYIRSMKLAIYSHDPLGHFGLALEDYTHFTSPIRRYIDLVVHRQLMDASYQPDIKGISAACTQSETRSFKAETSVILLKKLRYLNQLLVDDPKAAYSATITKIRAYGFFFDVDFLNFEGFLHISEIKKDYFAYFEESSVFVGQHSSIRLFVNKEITVSLKEVDLIFQECQWTALSID